VAGPGDQPGVRVVARLRGRGDGVPHPRGELRVVDPPERLQVELDALPVAGGAELLADAVDPGRDRVVVVAPDVDREPRLVGDDVDRAGADREFADGRHDVVGHPAGHPADRGHDVRGRHQRVVAGVHRRRAGVVGLAVDGRLQPGHPLDALDDAELEAAVLEPGALLDVELEERRRRVLPRPDRRVAVVADRRERLADGHPVAVGLRQRLLDVVGPDVTAAAHQCGLEPRPLLVGPVDDFDGPPGVDVLRLQHPHRL